MAGGTRPANPAPGETLALLPLAVARPREALTKARALLAADPPWWDASVAHQVVGIVLRDFGDVEAAIGELRAALRLARAGRSAQRQADVLATLGAALVNVGRTRSGLAKLDAAASLASGALAGRVLMRRGGMLRVLGRHREALADLRRAVTILRRAGDTMWTARALTARSLVHLALGCPERADADLGSAQRLYAATSQDLEVAYAMHNRALVAFRSGDLPAALSRLDDAARQYASLALPMPDVSIDRCAVLVAAGMTGDALAEAEAAVAEFEKTGGQPTKKAELLLAAANAALAAADPQVAAKRAQAARRLFGAQHRSWWHAQAQLASLRARYAAGLSNGRLLQDADAAAARLDDLSPDDAAQARLLAGRIALALGRTAEADRQLARAARARLRGPALSRLNGWLAEALRADAAADPRRLLAACRGGLGLLDEHRLTLGASELRAQATARGAELAELAQRCALRSGRPRVLLVWSERWRATALAVPPVGPIDDQALQADLTAARDVAGRLEKARAEGSPAAMLKREQLRLEAAIRKRVMRTSGPGTGRVRVRRGRGADEFDPAALLAELDGARLVQIVDAAGELHLLVCGAGRVRHVTAGRMADAAREVDFARFGLSRLAHALGGDRRAGGRPDDELAMLETTASRLEAQLLGGAARHLGDGPVVVVPPGRLHAVPWALLPSLRDRVVTVAPSARAWLRARAAAAPPAGGGVVLVRGPGTGTWGAEVPVLAAEYPGAVVLGEGAASAARVLGAIDGARLVHVAAHGTFRADSPMFSALGMDDGPLTVHDFERLRRAPHRMVLSSCDSGLLAPAGADELLGLASTLVPLGTAGIVASVVPVNDKAVVAVMLALHRRLRGGASLAEALAAARAQATGDPVQMAAGWSFVALGAW